MRSMLMSGDKSVECGRHFWSVGTHPKREGLTPLLKFDPVYSEDSTDVASEVSCYIRKKGSVEIRTDLSDQDFDNDSSPTSIICRLPFYEILMRLCDNGEGTITYKFVLDRTDLISSFDTLEKVKFEQQNILLDQLDMLPFIFTILTLGRTEARGKRNGAPLLKIRFSESKRGKDPSGRNG